MTEINPKKNIGKRIFAGIFDYLIIYTFFFIFVYSYGEPNEDGGYTVNRALALIPILFWAIMTVGIEQLFGATLGNYAVDLKPISIIGNLEKPSFGQSLKRHLLDPIDMFFFGIVGIITIKNSSKNQRLGDQWANTIVVNSKKIKTE